MSLGTCTHVGGGGVAAVGLLQNLENLICLPWQIMLQALSLETKTEQKGKYINCQLSHNVGEISD